MTGAQARELCRSLFLETLESLRVAPRLRQMMRVDHGILTLGGDSYPLFRFQSIRIVAFGKAAFEMAQTAAEILESANFRGVVVAPSAAGLSLSAFPQLKYLQGSHPYPDERSWEAAEAVLASLEDCSTNELVLFLISGGGSALVEKPLDPSVSLEDLRRFNEVLVTCGANIQEINVLRKHFSAIKGGRLAQRAAPAAQVTLYVSDVPDDLPSAVASGPTMPDESTVQECGRIAEKYGLLKGFPDSIRVLLESGRVPETPKPGDASFAQSRYYCLMSNRDGIHKVLDLACAKEILAEADVACDDWPLERAADYLLGRLDAIRRQQPGKPVLLVSGGELSSPVTGAGRGGRNQAFVLYCVPKIAGQPVVILSGGTDGIDGNSSAAGALADGETGGRAARLGLNPEEFLKQSDSFSFFEQLHDVIVTGPTGTNVRDLRILLAYE